MVPFVLYNKIPTCKEIRTDFLTVEYQEACTGEGLLYVAIHSRNISTRGRGHAGKSRLNWNVL